MNKTNDDNQEIERELTDPEIIAALFKSKRETEKGEIGTEDDVFRILRETSK